MRRFNYRKLLRQNETYLFFVLVAFSMVITAINPQFLTLENIFDLLIRHRKWPHFQHPYCHDLLHGALDPYVGKSGPDEVVIVRGGRAQEKAAVKKARPDRWMELKRLREYRFFHPLYFSDKGSSERILEEAGAPVWEGYSRGLCRTACRICPGQKPIVYAVIRREFPDVWAELLMLEARLGGGA